MHNITVTNNMIRDANYLSKASAAFTIHGDSDSVEPVGGNYDIYVDGLTIDNVTASNIFVGAATGVTLKNVTILNAFMENYTLWEAHPGAVVTFRNVKDSSGGACVHGKIGEGGIEMQVNNGTVQGFDMGAVKSC